jgi:hypothetical protein
MEVPEAPKRPTDESSKHEEAALRTSPGEESVARAFLKKDSEEEALLKAIEKKEAASDDRRTSKMSDGLGNENR